MSDQLKLERSKIGDEQRPLYPDCGTCYYCGRPWPVCKAHDTPYNDYKSCFPLCEDCWEELTPQERLPYYRQLWFKWKSFGHKDCNGVPWETTWEIMKQAVMAGL
jgi:hypothetical protein